MLFTWLAPAAVLSCHVKHYLTTTMHHFLLQLHCRFTASAFARWPHVVLIDAAIPETPGDMHVLSMCGRSCRCWCLVLVK